LSSWDLWKIVIFLGYFVAYASAKTDANKFHKINQLDSLFLLNGLSNRYTSKNLLTSIFTLADNTKMPRKKSNFQKILFGWMCRVYLQRLYTVSH
jgi:hypothetical protein